MSPSTTSVAPNDENDVDAVAASVTRCEPLESDSASDERQRKPLAVFVGKARLGDPRRSATTRQFTELHRRHARNVWVRTGRAGLRRVHDDLHIALPRLKPSLLGGLVFYSVAPVFAVLAAARRGPSAVICQSPLEGFGVVVVSRFVPRGRRPLVEIEVHSDWRAAPRLYGSRARRPLALISDRACVWALRRAGRVRVVSEAGRQWVREAGYKGPVDIYVQFSEFAKFMEARPVPLPEQPSVAFIGALQRCKAVDVLIDCWPSVLRRVPRAKLVIAGAGPMERSLRRRIRERGLVPSVEMLGHVDRDKLVGLLDRSWCMVLPSRTEGLPRVVLEAMARGRPVVATTVGGVRELLAEGETGWLVAPDEPAALSGALVEALSNAERTGTMGLQSRRLVEGRNPIMEYETGVERLAQWIRSQGNENTV